MRKKENITVELLALLISVVVHLYAAYVIPVPADRTAGSDRTYIELARMPDKVEPSQQKSEQRPEQEAHMPKPKPEKRQPESEDKKKKKLPSRIFLVPPEQRYLVDLGRPQESDPDKAPEDARFLSQRNTETDKETVKRTRARTGSPGEKPGKKPAKNPEPTTKDYENKPAGKNKSEQETSESPSRSQPAEPKPPQPESGKELAKRTPGRSHKRESPQPQVRLRQSDSPAPLEAPSPPVDKEGSEVRITRRKTERIKKEDLQINQYDASKTYESDDGSIEYFPSDVARGRITSLNSKAFTYAAFYNRINKIIRFYWEPQKALSHIKWPGTTLKTRLRIVMKDNGDLISVDVIDPCGYPLIDAAAVRAVRKAAPFYNVPQALLNEKDQFIYNLGFIIEAY